MDNALVSVIVPIYNVAEYLDDCIASITSQTYGNIEIILVDDGSTDNSREICDAWKEKDTRISVYHIDNSGPSAARNYGLDVAKGEYVYFCDSDDITDVSLLEKSMAVLNSDNEIDLLAFGYNVISTDNKYTNMDMLDIEYDMRTDAQRLSVLVGPFCKHELAWNLWNRLFKKRIIDQHQLRLDTRFRIGEDKLFCLMYLSHCKRVVTIHEYLYNYYIRTGSIMDTAKMNKEIDSSRFNNIAISLFEHYINNADCAFLQRNFSLLFYPLIESTIKGYETDHTDYKQLRACIESDLNQNSDINFFYEMLSAFDANSQLLRDNYSIIQRKEKKAYVDWLLKGNCLKVSLISRIKKTLHYKKAM